LSGRMSTAAPGISSRQMRGWAAVQIIRARIFGNSASSKDKRARKSVNARLGCVNSERLVGSIADALSAGVGEGRITRRELGDYMAGKGFQDSAVSRGLGLAVAKWGSLAKVKVPSTNETGRVAEGYVPCDGAYESLDELMRRPATGRFAFRFGGSFRAVGRHLDSPVPIRVDVVANESSTNCKAKVNVVPFGDRDVQVYWRPRDALSLDMNQGETARAELLEVDNPERRRIANYEGALKGETDPAVIEHVRMRLRQTYESAARQKPVCYVRTPDVEGGRKGVDSSVNVLVLTVYSSEGLSWTPFLLLRRRIEESEILPIVGYKSKNVEWPGRGILC